MGDGRSSLQSSDPRVSKSTGGAAPRAVPHTNKYRLGPPTGGTDPTTCHATGTTVVVAKVFERVLPTDQGRRSLSLGPGVSQDERGGASEAGPSRDEATRKRKFLAARPHLLRTKSRRRPKEDDHRRKLKRSILTERVSQRGVYVAREHSVDILERVAVGDVLHTGVRWTPTSLSVEEAVQATASAGETEAGLCLVESGPEVGFVARSDHRIGHQPLGPLPAAQGARPIPLL